MDAHIAAYLHAAQQIVLALPPWLAGQAQIAQRRQQGGIVGVGFKPDLGLAKAPRDMLGRALRIRIEQPGFQAYLQGRFENARGFVEDRQSVVKGKRVYVRVDRGGRRMINTKNDNTRLKEYSKNNKK